MMAVVRAVLLVLVGLFAVLPLFGHDDEGGGGDSGVWILPRSSYLGSGGGPQIISAPPRGIRHHPDLSRDLSLQMSSEMSEPTGVLTDPVTNRPIPLAVDGMHVTVRSATLRSIESAGVTEVYGTVIDSQGRGYILRLRIDPIQHTATLEIF